MPGSLDRQGELPLMLRASSGDPARDNLSLLRRKLDQPLVVFIIDVDVAVFAEPADFSFFNFFYWNQFIFSPI